MHITVRSRCSMLQVRGLRQVHLAVATRKMPQGVRTLPEILELAQAVEACPSLHLRGVMTHGGDYDVRHHFRPVSLTMSQLFAAAWTWTSRSRRQGSAVHHKWQLSPFHAFSVLSVWGCPVCHRRALTLCMS